MCVALLLPSPVEVACMPGDIPLDRLILGCTPTGAIQMSQSSGLALCRRPGGRVP